MKGLALALITQNMDNEHKLKLRQFKQIYTLEYPNTEITFELEQNQYQDFENSLVSINGKQYKNKKINQQLVDNLQNLNQYCSQINIISNFHDPIHISEEIMREIMKIENNIYSINLGDGDFNFDHLQIINNLISKDHIIKEFTLCGIEMSIDCAHSIYQIVLNSNIEQLNLEHLGMSNNEYLIIIQTLKDHNNNVKQFNIGNNDEICTQQDESDNENENQIFTQDLQQCLTNINCKIVSLNISNVSIGNEHCHYLAMAIKFGHTNIQELDISENNFGKTGAIELAEALFHNNHIKYLKINGCTNVKNSISEFAKIMTQIGNKLEQLNAGYTNFGNEGADKLAEALKSNHCKLKELFIYKEKCSADSINHILESLNNPQTKLQKLDICKNKFDLDCAITLSRAISQSFSKLDQLNLKSMKIALNPSIINQLSIGIANSKIKKIILQNNKINFMGAYHLSKAISNKFNNLKQINLNNNKISNEGAKFMASVLFSQNCKIKKLSLCNNSMTEEGVNSFEGKRHLVELDNIRINGESEEGIIQVNAQLWNTLMLDVD